MHYTHPRRTLGALACAGLGAAAFAAPAQAHDANGAITCTDGARLSLTGFANRSGNAVAYRVLRDGLIHAQGTLTFNGTSLSAKVADLTQDGLHHTWSIRAWWNTGGHQGGSETVDVEATHGVCGTPLLPPPTNPPETTPPPLERGCYSRREFRVRVARRHNNKFAAGYVVTDIGRTFPLALRSSGRLTTRVNWIGAPATRNRIRSLAFWLQRHDGTWVTGKRRWRLCTPKKGAKPRVLNLTDRGQIRTPYSTES
jgi:hypothetical protein